MTDAHEKRRLVITDASKPALPRFIKLRHDKERDRWVLLAPERILTPDDIAVEILKLCDGARSVESIASRLAGAYNAPQEQIQTDIIELLQDLADKGYLKA